MAPTTLARVPLPQKLCGMHTARSHPYHGVAEAPLHTES